MNLNKIINKSLTKMFRMIKIEFIHINPKVKNIEVNFLIYTKMRKSKRNNHIQWLKNLTT